MHSEGVDLEQLGNEIAAERTRAGRMTQSELAEATGVSVDSIRAYEQGRVKRPPRESWFVAAEEALEISDGRLRRAAGYLPPAAARERLMLSEEGGEMSLAEEMFLDVVEMIRPAGDREIELIRRTVDIVVGKIDERLR